MPKSWIDTPYDGIPRRFKVKHTDNGAVMAIGVEWPNKTLSVQRFGVFAAWRAASYGSMDKFLRVNRHREIVWLDD